MVNGEYFMRHFVSYVLWGGHALLIFLLCFEGSISLPPWLQVAGRIHPLLLHLPIGFLLFAAFLWAFRRRFPEAGHRAVMDVLLWSTAFCAVFTALFGFFLSKEGGYAPEALFWHRWTGVGTAWLCWLLCVWFERGASAFGLGLTATVAATVAAGHFGAVLTHGAHYLLEPILPNKASAPPADASAFQAAVVPILKAKCYSCHNPQKAKGNLVMTDLARFAAGGKNGVPWVPGDPEHSLLLQRALLPEPDDDHMPPAGKPQLTASELDLLRAWVAEGADFKKRWEDYAPNSLFRQLGERMAAAAPELSPQYTFEAAPAGVVPQLNTPFCAVYPLALRSPALGAAFFVRERYDPTQLQRLDEVKTQLTYLNLSNMPIGDDALPQLGVFQNLEKLLLNNTDVSNQGLTALKGLPHLHSLALSGTRVGEGISEQVAGFPALRTLFLWNTEVDSIEMARLARCCPSLVVERGFVPDTSEHLQLPVPTLKNESNLLADTEQVVLKNPFPGATVLLTFDGTVPASSTSARPYKGAFRVEDFTRLKAQTIKERWLPSVVAEFSLFRKGIAPDRAELLAQPNEQYKGTGVEGLTDGKKGMPENFRDPTWMGFREGPFGALFYFDGKKTVKSVTVSTCTNVGSYILPAARVEVWGGKDARNLRLLKTEAPTPLTKSDLVLVANPGTRLSIPPAAYGCLKVVAVPVGKLPEWHPGAGQKAWVFVDEVLFN